MNFYDFKIKNKNGIELNTTKYKNKVVLIVNTASKCGFTPQFDGLQKLYEKYNEQGFEVIGFPSNQFKQEPNSSSDASKECKLNYGVTFPMMGMTVLNGKDEDPLFTFLKKSRRGFLGSKKIKWNFTKFLIDSKGNVVKRYAPSTEPKKIEKDIKKYLEGVKC